MLLECLTCFFGIVAMQPAVTAAPADRYFGKLKMSALRVRYETMQLKKRYETHELTGDQTVHLLVLTEDAFDDWSRQYPKDPWLASTGYAMAHLYEELPGKLARDRAVKLFVYVKTSFPSTRYAEESRNELHRGISVKPEPSATPAPAPTATPTATGAPSATPSALPSVRPSPRPSSSPGDWLVKTLAGR
jgi:hypothetical protein